MITHPVGSIGGVLWVDLNENKMRDVNESGLANLPAAPVSAQSRQTCWSLGDVANVSNTELVIFLGDLLGSL